MTIASQFYILPMSSLILILLFGASSAASEDLDLQLYKAAQRGNVARVEKLIADGANLDARFEKMKLTPLIAAVRANKVEVVRLLIDAGADTERTDLRGWKPVTFAERYGYWHLVSLLNTGSVDNAGEEMLNPLKRFGKMSIAALVMIVLVIWVRKS
jgi:ankyrin repeat protein